MTFLKKNVCKECGGSFGTPSGVISSPFYPQELPRPFYCIWTVRVLPGRRITFKFTDFDLAGNHMEQRLYVNFLFLSTILKFPFRFMKRQCVAKLQYCIKITCQKRNIKRQEIRLKFRTRLLRSPGLHIGDSVSCTHPTRLLVRFLFNWFLGFLNFFVECGGYVNSTYGVLEPPQNRTKFYCEWVFPQLEQQNSSLVFELENAILGNASHFACNYHNAVGLMIFVDGEIFLC